MLPDVTVPPDLMDGRAIAPDTAGRALPGDPHQCRRAVAMFELASQSASAGGIGSYPDRKTIT
jgi:hypothetical protein